MIVYIKQWQIYAHEQIDNKKIEISFFTNFFSQGGGKGSGVGDKYVIIVSKVTTSPEDKHELIIKLN